GGIQVMNRREALQLIAASTSAALVRPAFAAQPNYRKSGGFGLVTYCCQFRQKMMADAIPPVDLSEPSTFLAHCKSLGTDGMQIALGVMDANEAKQLREQAETNGQYIEAIISLPRTDTDVEQFEAEVKTAAAVGAKAIRTTIMRGRRYEEFDSAYRFGLESGLRTRSLERAVPICESLKVPLAVENHKDHRNDERVRLFERISSEFVGACVDTGNSFALLEDPVETVTALAPWAHSVHLKDQAVQMYDDGFLLADIPLGQGFIDLKKIVAILKAKKPYINFSLELITRDPLKVPVLNESYWATLSDVPAKELARALRTVRDGTTDNLQYISRMTSAQQLEREDANVRESIDYARNVLGL
ncbi:MAG: sugar phosphate isomerase/epimerase family protein, partial [Planctomycetota bacterium]